MSLPCAWYLNDSHKSPFLTLFWSHIFFIHSIEMIRANVVERSTLALRPERSSGAIVESSKQCRNPTRSFAPMKGLRAIAKDARDMFPFLKGNQHKQRCLDEEKVSKDARETFIFLKNNQRVEPCPTEEPEVSRDGDILETYTDHSIAQNYPEAIQWNDPIQSLLSSGILQPLTPHASHDEEDDSTCSMGYSYDGFEIDDEEEDKIVLYGIPLDPHVRGRLYSCSDVDSLSCTEPETDHSLKHFTGNISYELKKSLQKPVPMQACYFERTLLL